MGQVLKGCGVIQGDAVSMESLKKILKAVTDAGFSAENVAFGMGGNLLQVLLFISIHQNVLENTTRYHEF